ncbi:hypothetical protein Agub_g9898, partial [Astrephomene gubernaculifera]
GVRTAAAAAAVAAAPMAATAADGSSFEDVALGMIHRLASATSRVLPPTTGTAFAALEPPPAQHVAAAAALAAASAAAAKHRSAGGGGSSGGAELELQVAMQGLMSAARQATSEEAMRAERERRRQEALAAAEAEIAASEERAVQLARAVLYLRLWRMAAVWARREVWELRAGLEAGRLRRCLAGWGAAARGLRAERLAGEALQLVEESRKEQIALQFRRLWLLHSCVRGWRLAAGEGAQRQRQEALQAEELER